MGFIALLLFEYGGLYGGYSKWTYTLYKSTDHPSTPVHGCRGCCLLCCSVPLLLTLALVHRICRLGTLALSAGSRLGVFRLPGGRRADGLSDILQVAFGQLHVDVASDGPQEPQFPGRHVTGCRHLHDHRVTGKPLVALSGWPHLGRRLLASLEAAVPDELDHGLVACLFTKLRQLGEEPHAPDVVAGSPPAQVHAFPRHKPGQVAIPLRELQYDVSTPLQKWPSLSGWSGGRPPAPARARRPPPARPADPRHPLQAGLRRAPLLP